MRARIPALVIMMLVALPCLFFPQKSFSCSVTAGFIMGQDSLCAGGQIAFSNMSVGAFDYVWLENGVPFSTSANPTHRLYNPGDIVITLIASDSACSDTFSLSLYTYARPVASIMGGNSSCSGDQVPLTASAAASWSWMVTPTLVTGQFSQTAVFQPTVTSSFSVVVIDSNNCRDTASHQITVWPKPAPVITPLGPTTFCMGDTLTLDAGAYNLYGWLPDGQSNRTIEVSEEGTYYVDVIDHHNCTGSASLEITVLDTPVAHFFANHDGLELEFVEDGQGNIVSWEWDFGDGNVENAPVPVHAYDQEGTYRVCLKVIDDNGCESNYCDSLAVRKTSLIEPLTLQGLVVQSQDQGRLLTLQWESQFPDLLELEVLDLLGRPVYRGDVTQISGRNVQRVEITQPAAVYLLHLSAGNAHLVKKIVTGQ